MSYKDPEKRKKYNRLYGREYRRTHRRIRSEKDAIQQKNWRLKNPERVVANNRKNYEQTRPNRRNYNLKRLYGISQIDYDELLVKQNGVCAICEKPQVATGANFNGRLHVDHNHQTGELRGLLCHNCNLAIGHAREDVEMLMRMAIYLEQHKNKPA